MAYSPPACPPHRIVRVGPDGTRLAEPVAVRVMGRLRGSFRKLRPSVAPRPLLAVALQWAAQVGKRRHRRRPSGHPAKVAARGARDSVRQSRRTAEGALDHTARRVCRDASELGGAFEAELWASGLLGTLWKHRFDVPPAELDDPALLLGRPLVEAVARHGGAGARVALSVIERVDDGALGVLAGELAHKLSAAFDPLPAWVGSVGDAEIERTAVMREDVFDDGFTVFIDARHPGDGRHAVGVYVDNNLGLMAKDILLADSIARVEQVMQERPDPRGEVRIEPLEPAAAAGHVHAAIELADMTLGAPVGEDYAGLRALALLRADELPGPSVEPERPDLTGEEVSDYAMSSSPRRKAASSRLMETRPMSRRWRSTSVPTTSMGAHCGGALSSWSCSWPTGFRARC